MGMEREENPSTKLDFSKTKAFKFSTIDQDCFRWPTVEREIPMDLNSLLEQFQVCGWMERISFLVMSLTEWTSYVPLRRGVPTEEDQQPRLQLLTLEYYRWKKQTERRYQYLPSRP